LAASVVMMYPDGFAAGVSAWQSGMVESKKIPV